jgi:hypothetical protein
VPTNIEGGTMADTIDQAVDMAAALLALVAGDESGGPGELTSLASSEISAAIEARDTPALFRILTDGFAFQGISDAGARGFIAKHGNANWADIEQALADASDVCPKLENFDTYQGCGFRKSMRTCANPDALSSCPVPRLPLRKGKLNETAFALFLLLRDRCGGDLVSFIDRTVAIATEQPDWLIIAREALMAAFTSVSGVSRKLAAMMLAVLLCSAGPERPLWIKVGLSMVAIDSLVHNFLHRTGIIRAYGVQHLYGQSCFGLGGCEAIIRDLAERQSDRSFFMAGPPISPRELQHAIWRFCAADELAICNGNRIRDTAACELESCPLRSRCSRVPLRTVLAQEAM